MTMTQAAENPYTIPPDDAPDPIAPKGCEWVDCYRNYDGKVAFYEYRMEPTEDKPRKWFMPTSWEPGRQKWLRRAWKNNRPLLGAELIAANPEDQILIVEGSKAMRAARKFVPPGITVVTWSGGSQAIKKTNWYDLAERSVVIWPDADPSGRSAAQAIARELTGMADSVKILQPEDDRPKGWDAADTGWGTAEFMDWATTRAVMIEDWQPPAVSAQQPIEGVSVFAVADTLGLQQNGRGVKASLLNACLLLEGMEPLRGKFWWDEFHCKIFTTWNGPEREFGDDDLIALQRWMEENVSMEFADRKMLGAIRDTSRRSARNEPKDWMESLEWDGTSRLETMFSAYWGAAQDEYTAAVGRNFMISMVARVFRPGSKVDTMPVLEGPQGNYKTTSLEVLGGKWYSTLTEKLDSKDFFVCIQGKLLIEVGEMDSLNYASMERVKLILSNNKDRLRMPYGYLAGDYPRQCVFAGTTNQDQYLKDRSGGRRFWPIKTGFVDLEALKRDRAQLFAEAVHLYKSGATWWDMPDEETKRQQEARRITDDWEDVLSEWIQARAAVEYLTPEQIYEGGLGYSSRADVSYKEQRRAGEAMRLLGWEQKPRRVDGKLRKVWVRSPE